MTDVNPYAAPNSELVTPAVVSQPSGGVWRDGALLVMHKQAVLPDRCVKCNAPAYGGRLKRSLSWHHPGFFLIALASPLIYVIVALIVRHTAKIEVGICEQHRSKRRRTIAISWIVVLAGIAAFILALSLPSAARGSETPQLILLFVSIGLFLGGLIYAAVAVPIVAPDRIDKEYVWLKKIDPGYLAQLPPINC